MKTIVSIISEQTIPNYLFIKEMFQPGDKLMFISSKKMSDRIQWIKNTLQWNQCESIDVVLQKNGDEEDWAAMTTQIKNALRDGQEYCVNLTGGTKFMALAVQSVFEKYDAKYYYIPYPQNTILSMQELGAGQITYRVSVEEYTKLYNQLLRKSHEPLMPEQYTDALFGQFVNHFSRLDFEVVDKLRAYRETRSIVVAEVEAKEDTEKQPRIEGLGAFLDHVSFTHSGTLSKQQTQYLTGGWFEEYIYYSLAELK